MELHIRPFRESDVDDVVDLSLLAWEPVFASMKKVLGEAIYHLIWPEWRSSQAGAVRSVCLEEKDVTVWVAEVEGKAVGYVAYKLHVDDRVGEVWLLAVHPQYQNQGIGTGLNTHALEKMSDAGMTLAKVETGGDAGHAPARRCYEKAGYTPLPIARYFKNLS
jgi:ribosomal protein S18 acetylase RimI-like enzyme